MQSQFKQITNLIPITSGIEAKQIGKKQDPLEQMEKLVQDLEQRIQGTEKSLKSDISEQAAETRHISELMKFGWIVIILTVVGLFLTALGFFTDVIFHKESQDPQIIYNVQVERNGFSSKTEGMFISKNYSSPRD